MIEFLLLPDHYAFSVALVVMLMIGIVEGLGLGFPPETPDVDGGGPAGPLGWLGFGRLPLLILLVVALGVFALVGLAIQQAALAWWGGVLPARTAGAAATLIALPLTAAGSRALARILPTDETSAVSLDTLLGRRGRILLGAARAGSPARARVRDQHGQSHYVLVEPNLAGDTLREGAEILLVAREPGHFRAIPIAPHFTLDEGDAA